MAKKETGERIKEIIARLVLKFSFSGYIFSNVRRIQNPYIPSIMGVGIMPSGDVVLMYHPELVDKTDDQNINYTLEHELLHLLNKHPIRMLRILANELDPLKIEMKRDILNIAADCAVNSQGKLPKQLTIGGKPWPLHFPKDYKLEEKMTTEAMYWKLLEQADKQMKKYKTLKKGSKPECKDGKGIMFVPGVGVVEVDMEGEGEGKPSDKEGTGQGKNIDYHGDWGSAADKSTDIGSLVRKADSQMTNIIKESLKQYQKRRGTLPGHYMELIEKALQPPQAPYYQIITRYVKASKLSKFKNSSAKINRKRTYVFGDRDIPIISPFPGKKRDMSFKIAILLDTSGSMRPDDIIEGLSGTKHIIEKDKYAETTVLEVDTTVEKEYKCKRISDIQFNIKGRGGTTLGPGFFRAKELGVDVCIAFTDAATESIINYKRKDLPKKMIFVVPEKAGVETIKGLGPIVRIKK
jgi:predicted metal-dependent peptidase